MMTQVIHKELLPGVNLTAVHTTKFKTCTVGITLLAPLDAETASTNALLPMVLRRGTQDLPDLQAISAALDGLYGGSVEPAVRRKGETHCIGFVGSFLDDAYALGGDPILEPATSLMGRILLAPAQEGGCFRSDYVEGERANLMDRIRAQINEKRQYSMVRLTALMCQGERFGVDRLGSESAAAAITPQSLWAQYQALLNSAPIWLYYCGSAPMERVEQALLAALCDLPRTERAPRPICTVPAAPKGGPNVVEERMDVTQGKLAMGFRLGGPCTPEEDGARLVFNAVYGGTTTSKLFMNVREKLSLCYFASSGLERAKGVMLVSSGIEFDQEPQARAEILAQLEACKAGDIDNEELEGARRSVVSNFCAAADSQGRLEDFWLAQAAAGSTDSPETMARRVEQVTPEQVVEAARRVTLDTIYFLNGREG